MVSSHTPVTREERKAEYIQQAPSSFTHNNVPPPVNAVVTPAGHQPIHVRVSVARWQYNGDPARGGLATLETSLRMRPEI